MALGSPTGTPQYLNQNYGTPAGTSQIQSYSTADGRGVDPANGQPIGPPDPSNPNANTNTTSANPMDQLYQQLMNQYRPQQDALKAGVDLTQNMAGARDSYYQGQAGFANQSYNNDLARVGSNRAMNQTDIGAAQKNLPMLDQLMALTRQSQGLNWQDLATQKNQINLDQTQANQKANSAGVSGGFGLAPGVQTGISQTNQGAMYSRDRATNASTQQDIGYQKSLIQTDMQKNLDTASLSKLQEKAKQFGMDEKDLYIGLQKSLAGLGLDRFTNANDLLKMANSTDQQQAALGEEILTQLYERAQAQGISANQIAQFEHGNNNADYYPEPKK